MIESISEFLFSITNGQLLTDTIWIWLWGFSFTALTAFVFVVSAIITATIWDMDDLTSTLISVLMAAAVVVLGLMPLKNQIEMLKNCRDFMGEIVTERMDIPVVVKSCQYKDNYYEEFSEFKAVPINMYEP
jgi:hypothetical protein